MPLSNRRVNNRVSPIERRMSATEAPMRFGELMGHGVEQREPVAVERSGGAPRVVISLDEYERLRAARQ